MRTILMWFLVGLGLMAAEQLPRGAANAETGLVTFGLPIDRRRVG